MYTYYYDTKNINIKQLTINRHTQAISPLNIYTNNYKHKINNSKFKTSNSTYTQQSNTQNKYKVPPFIMKKHRIHKKMTLNYRPQTPTTISDYKEKHLKNTTR